jgi:hypothetical protein
MVTFTFLNIYLHRRGESSGYAFLFKRFQLIYDKNVEILISKFTFRRNLGKDSFHFVMKYWKRPTFSIKFDFFVTKKLVARKFLGIYTKLIELYLTYDLNFLRIHSDFFWSFSSNRRYNRKNKLWYWK